MNWTYLAVKIAMGI